MNWECLALEPAMNVTNAAVAVILLVQIYLCLERTMK